MLKVGKTKTWMSIRVPMFRKGVIRLLRKDIKHRKGLLLCYCGFCWFHKYNCGLNYFSHQRIALFMQVVCGVRQHIFLTRQYCSILATILMLSFRYFIFFWCEFVFPIISNFSNKSMMQWLIYFHSVGWYLPIV